MRRLRKLAQGICQRSWCQEVVVPGCGPSAPPFDPSATPPPMHVSGWDDNDHIRCQMAHGWVGGLPTLL